MFSRERSVDTHLTVMGVPPGVHFTWGEGQDTGPRDTWNLHAGHVTNKILWRIYLFYVVLFGAMYDKTTYPNQSNHGRRLLLPPVGDATYCYMAHPPYLQIAYRP